MLEIIILFKLCSNIAAKARRKGRRGWPYGLMLVAMWFMAEFGGGVVGFILFEDEIAAVGVAIIGAVVAAVSAFVIVGALPPNEPLSARWQPAQFLFDIDESDTATEIRRGDLVCAPVAIRPGDLLRLEHVDDGRIQLQTVFEDELDSRPGRIFRAEESPTGGLPRLVTVSAPKKTSNPSGNGDLTSSTQFKSEPPAS